MLVNGNNCKILIAPAKSGSWSECVSMWVSKKRSHFLIALPEMTIACVGRLVRGKESYTVVTLPKMTRKMDVWACWWMYNGVLFWYCCQKMVLRMNEWICFVSGSLLCPIKYSFPTDLRRIIVNLSQDAIFFEIFQNMRK